MLCLSIFSHEIYSKAMKKNALFSSMSKFSFMQWMCDVHNASWSSENNQDKFLYSSQEHWTSTCWTVWSQLVTQALHCLCDNIWCFGLFIRKLRFENWRKDIYKLSSSSFSTMWTVLTSPMTPQPPPYYWRRWKRPSRGWMLQKVIWCALAWNIKTFIYEDDLTKPYVSYKTKEINQEKLTSR